MSKSTTPQTFLIGVTSVIIGTAVLAQCAVQESRNGDDDAVSEAAQKTITVERRHYRSVDDCMQTWGHREDCTNVAFAEAQRSMTPISLSSTRDAADTATSASAGTTPPAIRASPDDAPGWYGPYYTRSGVIYHAAGTFDLSKPRVDEEDDALSISRLTVRQCAFEVEGDAIYRTPQQEAQGEASVISRGGFFCPPYGNRDDVGGGAYHGVGSGEGGAHGGGHGGGGHGSGGG